MPVITPAYPCINSTFNATRSTLTTIKHEMNIAKDLVVQCETRFLEWSALFEKSPFFLDYKHFIEVTAESGSKEEHVKWYTKESESESE